MGAAIVIHDLIAWPLYTLLMRVAEEGIDATVRPRRRALLTLNHIRIPAAFSLALLLISFPLVFVIDEPSTWRPRASTSTATSATGC